MACRNCGPGVSVVTSSYSAEDFTEHATLISVGGNFVFFAVQALLTPRLVRKNYRSFRVSVFREDGVQERHLSIREACLVWAWIFIPQMVLMVTVSVIGLFGESLPPGMVRSLSGLSQWVRSVLVGPYAVGLALRMKYPGFRLQGYGYRYI